MRNRFDKLAKDLGQAALGACGAAVVNDPIHPGTQYADLRYEPDPARRATRERLGLLGRIAGAACLIEVYSQAPSAEELRACLAKHLAHWQQRTRQARAGTAREPVTENAGDAPTPEAAPMLWVIAAGTPTTLLTQLPMVPAADGPPGVYSFGATYSESV